MTAQRDLLIGTGALAGGAVVIGFAAILVKASDLGPQAIAFWRLTLAIPALLVWLWIEQRRARRCARPPAPPGKAGWKAVALAGVFFAGDLAFWHAGIKLTTAANATLLANLTPILVALAAWALFKERITSRFLLAGAVALGGAALLSAANVRFAPERLPGDVLSALTAVWYAAYILAVRAARRAGLATVKVMLWSTCIASPIALLVTLAFSEDVFPATLAGWAPIMALGVIVHVGGQGAIAFGLGRTPAALAALVILVQPVVAAAAGWVLFGEALLPLQWLGAALIMAGIYMAQLERRTPPGPWPLRSRRRP